MEWIGAASIATPDRSQSDSQVLSLPIEYSPPGIHTMPSGAGVGAAVLLGMVGSKAFSAEKPVMGRSDMRRGRPMNLIFI